MTTKHTPTPYNYSSDSFAPPAKDVYEKSIGYAYPTSPRADYFNAGKTGCYFVSFNKDNAHTGPFETLEEAEKWCDERYPNVKYGYYSKRIDATTETWRQNLPSAMAHAKGV